MIINGLMRARAGVKVAAQEQGAPPAASSAPKDVSKEANKDAAQTKAD